MSDIAPPPQDGVLPVELRSALEERYLAYALSTITQRALPDVRDGLKPVHRRVLWAMRELKLDPGAAFKKCARVVGDTIGKYHPHGDQSVYDALVRLAQDFAQRWPLVEGQGNFGNIDGDNAAAMRYTEARLTEVARLLLDGLDEDAVDYRATYDGTEKEPIVLPGAFPNLLANGSQGIAVGMATSIPPHNVAELVAAAKALLADPAADTDALLAHVQGPDFPTGGVVVDSPSVIAEAYRTGRGGFRTRARWAVEDQGRGTWIAVVTEIPYLVPKSRLVERIAELINERKLPLVADVRDESTEDVRLVIEPRARTVDPVVMMEQLFKLTELESRIPLNMNVLVRGQTPMVLGLKDALRQWLDHRREVIQRRSQHRLDAIVRRLEILDGLLIAFLNVDEVIRIVRQADDPKADLIAAFALTETQADAILNMRLRSLAKLEEIEIRREHDKLTKEGEELRALLGSEARQWKRVGRELDGLAKTFGPDTPLGKRRTSFERPPDGAAEAMAEALVEREPVTVVVSEKGWIRALKGHIADVSGLTFKADDALKLSFHAETTSKLIVAASTGKTFTLDAAKLPGGRGAGEPIRLMVDMDEGAEIVDVFAHVPGARRLVVSSDARGFVVAEEQLLATTRKGRQVANVEPGVTLLRLAPAQGDTVAIVGENRKLLLFPLAQVAEMARGRGVRLQRYKDGGVSDVKVFTLAEGFSFVTNSGATWSLKSEDLRDWLGNRAESGRLPPRGFSAKNRFGG
ncbi:DNA topoisomerase 4 subunit A [Methylopila jiangsuensis]|uniref:DNA topoisomerase 4 subunit A n=1 Tax=Methylopila jiangsuensis TaxID=586230 RepID=A0A9W6JDU3_9HYPH|nr:DNA topoisomerase IV subunit A [Methylopila jiangsuensis]MDR6285979.1 topoisomerase-4 subunit A [Methylopila jiangsuensis]GLK75736.1 DNA topoisomerase 4 subunit A [Methylopila jiangsuensis]